MTFQRPGVDTCPGCERRVLYAIAADGSLPALDPDEHGTVIGWQDETGTARCRPDERGQLALGEYLFRRHEPSCPAPVAPVIPLQSRRRQHAEPGRYAL